MGFNSLPWYYAAGLTDMHKPFTLTGDEWHHCLHVMRLGPGDRVILFNGTGHCYEGRIITTAKQEGIFELIQDCTLLFTPPLSCHINIAFAPTKNIDRTEFAVEKITELGVNSITFIESQHSERVHLRLDRMLKIAMSAAKQSRKLFLPDMTGILSLKSFLQQSKIQIPNSKIISCHLDETSRPLHHTYQGEESVCMLIGPEGGFSQQEVEEMKSFGAETSSLGPHRLRVETAVIAACANLRLLYDLKHTL